MYFDQFLGAARQVHVVYSDQFFGASHSYTLYLITIYLSFFENGPLPGSLSFAKSIELLVKVGWVLS